MKSEKNLAKEDLPVPERPSKIMILVVARPAMKALKVLRSK